MFCISGFQQSFGSGFHDNQFLFVHRVQLPDYTLAALVFRIVGARVKELIYRNIQKGDNLKEDINTWTLAMIFNVKDGSISAVYQLRKMILRLAFFVSSASDFPTESKIIKCSFTMVHFYITRILFYISGLHCGMKRNCEFSCYFISHAKSRKSKPVEQLFAVWRYVS